MRRTLAVPAFLLCLAAALGAAEPTGEAVHYWSGDQRVEVWLALDEVAVPAGKDWTVEPMAKGGREQVAAKGAGSGAHAVLYADAKRSEKPEALTARLSLQLKPGGDIATLAALHHLVVVEAVSYSPDTWILQATDPLAALAAANALYEGGDVVFATPLIARQRGHRATTNDPLLAQQWHLPLIGAQTAWDTATGMGVNIAIVDDGLEHTHPDLNNNARTALDIDINDGDLDPAPGPDDGHGTIVGGVAAADGNDATGTAGVAFNAGLVGVRLIAGPADDSDEAVAMNHRTAEAVDADRVHVSNNSWGPADNGAVLGVPGPLYLAALANATTVGRGGRGVVFCWAAGNGGLAGDDSAYDGYSGNRYTIGVASCDPSGVQASYSESGCNVMITAPGGAFGGQGIVAPDRVGGAGSVAGDYTVAGDDVVGTSFATPVVAGVAALLLDADPTLTWRDVMHVLIRTAEKNQPGDGGWFNNGAGLHFNHRYGFGLVAADAAVAEVAAGWQNVPPSATALTASQTASLPIPDNSSTGLTTTLSIAGSSRFRAEHVQFTVSISHQYRGDLAFELTSPSGSRSVIPARAGDSGNNFSNWTFTTVVNWGENPNGTWRLKITDTAAEDAGTLTRWSLRVHGFLAPSRPVITSITPALIETGSPDTMITVNGSGFDNTSVVLWDGTPLPTTFVSATQLTAIVSAAQLAAGGPHTVTVSTDPFDGAGGGVSAGSTVTASPRFAPLVVTDPTDRTVLENRSGAFAVSFNGLPAPTLQWERSDDGGTTWTPIGGATGATYNTPSMPLSTSGALFHAVATNSEGSTTSAAAVLTVIEPQSLDNQDDCAMGSGFTFILALVGIQLAGRSRRRR